MKACGHFPFAEKTDALLAVLTDFYANVRYISVWDFRVLFLFSLSRRTIRDLVFGTVSVGRCGSHLLSSSLYLCILTTRDAPKHAPIFSSIGVVWWVD